MIGSLDSPERFGSSEAKAVFALRELKERGGGYQDARNCQPFMDWYVAAEQAEDGSPEMRLENTFSLVRVLFAAGWEAEAEEYFTEAIAPLYSRNETGTDPAFFTPELRDEVVSMAGAVLNMSAEDFAKRLVESGYTRRSDGTYAE